MIFFLKSHKNLYSDKRKITGESWNLLKDLFLFLAYLKDKKQMKK